MVLLKNGVHKFERVKVKRDACRNNGCDFKDMYSRNDAGEKKRQEMGKDITPWRKTSYASIGRLTSELTPPNKVNQVKTKVRQKVKKKRLYGFTFVYCDRNMLH